MEGMVKAKVANVLESANHKAGKDEKSRVYQAVEEVVRRIVARRAVKRAIHIKVDNTAEL